MGRMNDRVRRCVVVLALGLGLLAASRVIAQDIGPVLPEAAPPEVTSPETAPAAAAVPPPVPAAFNSPAATLRTFLEAMAEPPDYERAVACMDLTRVGEDAGRDEAIKLWGILNRIEVVAFWQHPAARDLRDPQRAQRFRSLSEGEYVFFPRYPDHAWVFARADLGDHEIVLAPMDDRSWRFSAETVEDLDDFYDRISSLPVLEGLADETRRSLSLRLQSLLPDGLVENKFLGLKYWQWIGLFALILLGVVLDYIVRFIVAIISRRIITRQGGEAARDTIRKTVRPFGLAAAALFWLGTVRLLGLPAEALTVVLFAARFFAMLAGVWAGFRVTDLVAEVLVRKAGRTETKFDDLLVPLVRKTVKIFIFIFGLIYIADSLRIEIAPLLAGLGIGGIGFAFAARDTLENFFGSVTVIVDRPFQVGDWVVIGDVEGTVETLGFRSTRIRTFYNSLVTIPNGNLVRATVDNYGQRKYRRWKTHIAVTYGTPPDRLEAFCEGIREIIRLPAYTRKDYYRVWLHQFGASSLDVLVYMFHEAPDWTTELRERHRFMLDIIRLADRLGVEFAFPTETVHLYQEAADTTPAPEPPPGAGHEQQAMADGRRAARQLTGAADWRHSKPEPYTFTKVSPDDDETQIESTSGGDAS
jgi:MscS family membrane protein